MRGCAYPYIPCDTKTLQESQHTAGVVHVTALLHIPHGYLGVLGLVQEHMTETRVWHISIEGLVCLIVVSLLLCKYI